ncbi:MAG: hypothetical protein CO040_01225, partial [Candidatus Pacebacteria bacterium CG_4_9_14_0_2_um_filter_36_8]
MNIVVPNSPVNSSIQASPEKKLYSAEPKKKKNFKLIVAALSLLMLMAGGLVGLYLTKISQDVRQQADTGAYTQHCGTCGSGQTCVPPGVGGVNDWHCSTCAPGWVGVDDVGCLQPTSPPNCPDGDCEPNPTTPPVATATPGPTTPPDATPTVTPP